MGLAYPQSRHQQLLWYPCVVLIVLGFRTQTKHIPSMVCLLQAMRYCDHNWYWAYARWFRHLPLPRPEMHRSNAGLFRRWLFQTIVKDDKSGNGQSNERFAIFMALDIRFLQIAEILHVPQRHVRVIGWLLLIQAHLIADEKRNIVVHPHINHFFDCRNLNGRCIRKWDPFTAL